MAANTIRTMDAFAGTVKVAMEGYFSKEVLVTVQKVTKNNGAASTGITVIDRSLNLAPVIYLEPYYSDYICGEPMGDICRRIIEVYKENRVTRNFDVSVIMDFDRARSRICCQLINAGRNMELLADAPHVIVKDLAMVFYILTSRDETSVGSIIVKKRFAKMWGVGTEELYKVALRNTQRLFRSRITSMQTVLEDVYADSMDEEDVRELFDTIAGDGAIPMYVATNTAGLNGAAVMLYKNLLKRFARKIGGDFYVIPSSIHELLFIPCLDDVGADYLRFMVQTVNNERGRGEDYLGDNVYLYDSGTDCLDIV